MNTPSYMGGTLLQKGEGTLQPSAQAALNSWDSAAAEHAEAVRGYGVDPQITKARLDRATTQCHVEMVKMARSRPVALGDRGVINMMRHGRP